MSGWSSLFSPHPFHVWYSKLQITICPSRIGWFSMNCTHKTVMNPLSLMFETATAYFFVSGKLLGMLLLVYSGVKADSSVCVPRSASWHCGYLSSWSRSPTSTYSTACFCVAWRRGTTWRTNPRMTGSLWRTGSPMMPCKDLPHEPPWAALESYLEKHLHKHTPVEIKWMHQLAVCSRCAANSTKQFVILCFNWWDSFQAMGHECKPLMAYINS